MRYAKERAPLSHEKKRSRGYLFTIIKCCVCLIRVYLAARVSLLSTPHILIHRRGEGQLGENIILLYGICMLSDCKESLEGTYELSRI